MQNNLGSVTNKKTTECFNISDPLALPPVNTTKQDISNTKAKYFAVNLSKKNILSFTLITPLY